MCVLIINLKKYIFTITMLMIIYCLYQPSLNPMIDIGQVEGAFTMGLGLYLSEDIKFDGTTGRILNDGTWVCSALFKQLLWLT